MAEASRSPLRLGVVLALAGVALFQVLTLFQGVRSTRRLQARVTHDVQRSVEAVRPQIEAQLSLGGRRGWNEVAALVIGGELATEVEVIDARGRRTFALPRPAPVVRDLRPDERRRVAGGTLLTVIAGDPGNLRALSHLGFRSEGRQLILRLATPLPDLEEELRDRRQIILGHGASLVALLLAVLLVLVPRRGSPSEAPPAALLAYEEAMELLRDRGEELTARHEAERERLEEAVAEKEALARAGELTAGIVHEVRNGLATIVGYARLLEREGADEDTAEAARAIHAECQTLEAVVRRFNEFIREERLNLAEIDLSALLKRVVAREMQGRDEVVTSLVGVEERIGLRGDEELLERAFENLVRNAAEAARDGGGRVEVEVVDTGQGHLEVVIDDDGPGLPPDHPGGVQPFFSTKAGGLGLGLPLARKILLLHGGTLSLEDGPEGGARAYVTLPARGPTS